MWDCGGIEVGEKLSRRTALAVEDDNVKDIRIPSWLVLNFVDSDIINLFKYLVYLQICLLAYACSYCLDNEPSDDDGYVGVGDDGRGGR